MQHNKETQKTNLETVINLGIYWVVVLVAFLGLSQGNIFFTNVALFLIWLSFSSQLVILVVDKSIMVPTTKKQLKTPYYKETVLLTRAILVFLCVSTGYIATGIAVSFSLAFHFVFLEEAMKEVPPPKEETESEFKWTVN